MLAIDRITWDERLAQDASIKVFARTCQQAGCSDDPAWMEAVKAMPVVAARGRYLQLRVDMTSDGIHEPELHRLEVAYLRGGWSLLRRPAATADRRGDRQGRR